MIWGVMYAKFPLLNGLKIAMDTIIVFFNNQGRLIMTYSI